MIKKFFVIGSKTSESLSPLIFNYWFQKYKINAEYKFKEIKPHNFNKQINEILNEKDIYGFNITIPYKELIINNLSGVDVHSLKIGAVNCATKINKTWSGKNTDWEGFLTPFLLNTKNIFLENVIVIGGGGAAKAIIYALQKQDIKEIKIFNRTYKNIKNLNTLSKIKTFELFNLKNYITKNSIIINTTPINPLNEIEGLDIDESIIGYDIVYKPKTTEFLSYFKANRRIHGIDMLIYQAAPCFEHWFGITPKIDLNLYKLLSSKISQ